MEENNDYKFTERETEILKELVSGKNNTRIADEMCLSIHTVKFYVSSILAKLSVTTRLEAAVKVVKEHIIEPEQ